MNHLQKANRKKNRNVAIILGAAAILEGAIALGMANLMVIGVIDDITPADAQMVRMAFAVLFVFVFGLTAAIARNFISNVGMQLQDLGKAGLKAIRGEIDEIIGDDGQDENSTASHSEKPASNSTLGPVAEVLLEGVTKPGERRTG